MLKFVIIATVLTLCLSQDLGDDDYIACDDCEIPDGEFPEEGKMVCFAITRKFKPITTYVQECHKQKCNSSQPFCVPQKRCYQKPVISSIPKCHLERKSEHRLIPQILESYEIHSPHFHSGNGYPTNTYCVWNIANSGLVSYHVMEQQLQEPRTNDCEGPDCDCPDFVKITMGSNEVKLCGSVMPSTVCTIKNLVSSDGLHAKFCSDNKHTAKGINILATKSPETKKREAKQWQKQDANEPFGNSTGELNHATCQYNYMMHASQPDVPCPDNLTILSMLEYHNRLMSVSKQNDEMCSGMRYSTSMNSMMPQMNKIEMCAVEYLYHTRDCKFAKMVINSVNKELSSVAHAVITNMPKWMNITSTKCTDGDD